MKIPISQTGEGFDLDLSPDRLIGYLMRSLLSTLRDPQDHFYPEPARVKSKARGRFEDIKRSVSIDRVGSFIHISIDPRYFYYHKSWRVIATPNKILGAVGRALFAYIRDSIT